jgi:methionyl-tRNA formyltransferase
MRKIAVVGNTKLTQMCIEECLLASMDVCCLYSLSSEDTLKKVNGVDLRDYCNQNNIVHIDSDWETFNKECIRLGVEIVFVLGDSRIVPKMIINNFYMVIGNHGAVLPSIKGGASLVWGRMLNLGHWGVSLFQITEKIDDGPILGTKTFEYDSSINMRDFVNTADECTVEILKYVCKKLTHYENLDKIPNDKWHVKIAKHMDAQVVCNIVKDVVNNNMNVYLPPRNLLDSKINDKWSDDFVGSFKAANNSPYPIWSQNE